MEGNETRDSKQCKCHVGGGPGGLGEEIVTKSKRRFQSCKEKGEDHQKQESKETWRKRNPLVCDGWYGLKT